MKHWIMIAALGAAAPAWAQAPHVWFDTERGPIVLELDPGHAPLTTAHFLGIVNEGFYDNLVFHRTVPNFVVQAGRTDGNGQIRQRNPNPTVASERNNGLTHTPGTVSIALSSSGGGPNHNSGTTEFFINTASNSSLNGDYTVFGRVVYGMPTVNAIGNGTTYQNSNNTPFRPVLIRRAVQTDGFPVMPLHAGSWYDPANSGRGFVLEISNALGGDATPLMIAYWYDYFDGRQVWMNGAVAFQYGDSEVTVPLQISDGGQFGEDFDPAAVSYDSEFGSLTIRFSGCAAGSFSYDTQFGSGTRQLLRITVPTGEACTAN